eukprot:24321-Eustigmatos_ZCMA.PRE.1
MSAAKEQGGSKGGCARKEVRASSLEFSVIDKGCLCFAVAGPIGGVRAACEHPDQARGAVCGESGTGIRRGDEARKA